MQDHPATSRLKEALHALHTALVARDRALKDLQLLTAAAPASDSFSPHKFRLFLIHPTESQHATDLSLQCSEYLHDVAADITGSTSVNAIPGDQSVTTIRLLGTHGQLNDLSLRIETMLRQHDLSPLLRRSPLSPEEELHTAVENWLKAVARYHDDMSADDLQVSISTIAAEAEKPVYRVTVETAETHADLISAMETLAAQMDASVPCSVLPFSELPQTTASGRLSTSLTLETPAASLRHISAVLQQQTMTAQADQHLEDAITTLHAHDTAGNGPDITTLVSRRKDPRSGDQATLITLALPPVSVDTRMDEYAATTTLEGLVRLAGGGEIRPVAGGLQVECVLPDMDNHQLHRLAAEVETYVAMDRAMQQADTSGGVRVAGQSRGAASDRDPKR